MSLLRALAVLLLAAPAAAQTGLTPAERAEFYHLPEGSEIFPVDWLRATTSVATSRPFLDDLGRFGLLPDPAGAPLAPGDSRKLPVGLTLTVPRGSTMIMLGVNCAACHAGELRANGTAVRIDGAPGLFDIQTFYEEMFLSALATVADDRKLVSFLTALHVNGPRDLPTKLLVGLLPYLSQPPADRDPRAFEGLLLRHVRGLLAEADHAPPAGVPGADAGDLRAALKDGLLDRVKAAKAKADLLKELLQAAKARKIDADALPLLLARVGFLNKIRQLQTYNGRVPKPGPGRVDAFTNARNFLFDPADSLPPEAPVRYPVLWGLADRWLHWDGNTNSIMERNIGQSLGVGAIVDPRSLKSTVLPANLHRLEELARKLTPPTWPAAFGAVDVDGEDYKAGEKAYADRCASCHERQEPGRYGRKAPKGGVVYRVGTDGTRLKTFGTPMKTGADFAAAIGAKQRAIKVQSFANHETALADVLRTSTVPLDLPQEKIVWQKTDGYVARPMAGAWATGPYLHNGSVPTLADLLEPAAKRPYVFPVGHRAFDVDRVGFVSTFDKVPAAEWSRVFAFDTRLPGNRNTGHEFGTNLSPAAKKALIAYLKAKPAKN